MSEEYNKCCGKTMSRDTKTCLVSVCEECRYGKVGATNRYCKNCEHNPDNDEYDEDACYSDGDSFNKLWVDEDIWKCSICGHEKFVIKRKLTKKEITACWRYNLSYVKKVIK